jgi:hypothetical protein
MNLQGALAACLSSTSLSARCTASIVSAARCFSSTGVHSARTICARDGARCRLLFGVWAGVGVGALAVLACARWRKKSRPRRAWASLLDGGRSFLPLPGAAGRRVLPAAHQVQPAQREALEQRAAGCSLVLQLPARRGASELPPACHGGHEAGRRSERGREPGAMVPLAADVPSCGRCRHVRPHRMRVFATDQDTRAAANTRSGASRSSIASAAAAAAAITAGASAGTGGNNIQRSMLRGR